MPGCPDCHIMKGLFSDLRKKEDGTWVCENFPSQHKYTRDREGNFHRVYGTV